MSHEYIINQLELNIAVFTSLLSGAGRELYTWKPAEEKWCMLEVLCHLHDEEQEDFRARVIHILNNPAEPMAAINPPAWVTEREYMLQDYNEVLRRFITERKASVEILRGLDNPPWQNVYQHPVLGPMTAEMILANWLAHDYLHIRQIDGLKYGYLQFTSGQELAYAGNW